MLQTLSMNECHLMGPRRSLAGLPSGPEDMALISSMGVQEYGYESCKVVYY